MSTCTKCFVFTEKCQVCELEAKNVELEEKIKAFESIQDKYLQQKGKLDIACGELLSHCAWENTKENCDCSACKSLAVINAGKN